MPSGRNNPLFLLGTSLELNYLPGVSVHLVSVDTVEQFPKVISQFSISTSDG